MLSTYQYPHYSSPCPAEISEGRVGRAPVVVVGAGPVGLAFAIDLALRGTAVVVLDEDHTVSIGSRGVCYAKRTLEVLDRYGVATTLVDKGVSWNVGRTFFGDDEVYQFNLLPQPDHQFPGMINLQQYYLEQYLVERAQQIPLIDLRFDSKVSLVEPLGGGENGQTLGARLAVSSQHGDYSIETDWLVVADGARSPIRRMLGLDIEGKIFTDRFLIADVVMKADFPTERWFWFDPPFHRNQSVLLHKQADNVWRIDFQLGWDADPEEAKKPENVLPRIRAMLGPQAEFELEWVSVYTFQCRRMTSFRHGRVLFIGDAAHQVSPFGARGANSGIQDGDNLGWKLQCVLDGHAPETLLDSYDQERCRAADENIMNSTRSTDFITPKSAVSKLFRNAVLDLARHHSFARALVNSGRLSVPTFLLDSPLNTPDREVFAGDMVPGAPMDDAPVRCADGQVSWLLRSVAASQQFVAIYRPQSETITTAEIEALRGLVAVGPRVHLLWVADVADPQAFAAQLSAAIGLDVSVIADIRQRIQERYDLQAGTGYLIRPDQHVVARWRTPQAEDWRAACQRACGRSLAFSASQRELQHA